MIKTASHSRLMDFESCNFKAKLKYIDKIPEPERPLPPGKSEHANDRGTRIHTAAEMFVKGGIELISELNTFKTEFLKLRELYKQKQVSLEGDWAVDKDWNPVAWQSADVWNRAKLDAFVRLSKTRAVIIDFKSGRRFGNEVKHAEQGQLYQLMAFMRFPELEEITVEFWYVDLDDIMSMAYTKPQGLRYIRNFNTRIIKMLSAETFPASRNKFACKYCPYNGNACTVGVR